MHNIIDEKFWLAIAFLAFVLLVLKYVWPILSQKISDESKNIAAQLLSVKEMKEKAEKLLADSQKKYDDALVSSAQLIEDAKKEATKLLKDSKDSIESDIAKKMAALENRIKSEEEKTVREIKSRIISSAFDSFESGLKNAQKNNLDKVAKSAVDDLSKVIH
jgi:F-type H+-transporting ATPase subunit b